MRRLYYCDNECDPHEEVEASEHVVETFLPILSLWWGYDIFAECLGQASDCRGLETSSGGGGEPLVDQVDGNSMNINLPNSVGFVR